MCTVAVVAKKANNNYDTLQLTPLQGTELS